MVSYSFTTGAGELHRLQNGGLGGFSPHLRGVNLDALDS